MSDLKESGEMYLESIYILGKGQSPVRSVDVAERMNYSRASVCRGVALLKKSGLITVNTLGHISLTESGLAAAEKIFERHSVLSEILTELGVDKDTASEDACKIEHIISDETFNALKKHLKEYKGK